MRDRTIRRAVGKWLNAGVMEDGAVRRSERGTPQGGVISPRLSNLYLHPVLDEWFERDVKPRLRGRAVMVRFADDAVLAFEREEDARRVYAVLGRRFEKYGLRLHPDKTRLADFRSPPRRKPGGTQRERRFALPGFTHHWGRSRKRRWTVKRKTAKDRLARAMRAVGDWCRRNRHRPVAVQWEALRRKLLGHYAYYGVTGNYPSLARFHWRVRATWYKWLCRRSPRARMTRDRFLRLCRRWPLPRPRVVQSVYRAATPSPEEPDARIAHVRICGSRGGRPPSATRPRHPPTESGRLDASKELRRQPLPLDLQPRREVLRRRLHFPVQFVPRYPTPLRDLCRIHLRCPGAVAHEHGTQFELAADVAERRLVLELEQELGCHGQPELLAGTAHHGLLDVLAEARMGATPIRPVSRPKPLVRVSLLKERLASVVEDEQRKSPVQRSIPIVAGRLVECADLAILLVDQYQRFSVAGYDLESCSGVHGDGYCAQERL